MAISVVAASAAAHEVTPPKPLVQPAPLWPDSRPYVHDVVVPVLLQVAANGSVSDVQIEASVSPSFDAAARQVAQQWLFTPAQSEGKPVPSKIRAIVRFVGNATATATGACETSPLPATASRAEALESTAEARLRATTSRAEALESTAEARLRATSSGAEALESTAEGRLQSAPMRVEKKPNTAASAALGGSAGSRAQSASSVSGIDVEVQGERSAPPRSASETTRTRDIIGAAPHRTAGDVLQVIPGVFITQHSGQGKAYQVFYRGFDAVHGQDLEFWVGGAPVNEVSNIHGQGYADLHFVMPEVVSRVSVQPGNYGPEQGDFAVAGTIRYDLGLSEPGTTIKGTLGSFGERRAFLAFRPYGAKERTFAAFEAESTNGFGPARAAERVSGVMQQVVRMGDAQLRLLATGYSGRFDSPGVVRLRDIESGALNRFDTYGTNQGGHSSRYQLVGEYRGADDKADWAIAPYFVQRGLQLVQNYTGYLLNESEGDTTRLLNESTTWGANAHYRRRVRWISSNDAIEAGVSLRNDWITQSQDALGSNSAAVARIVDARIRGMNAAGWAGLVLSPISRMKLRFGTRVDGLSYAVEEMPTSGAQSGAGTGATSGFAQTPSGGAVTRTAMGVHVGPRLTVDAALARGVHALFAYGEGFRSPQARSLGHGERAPFTNVRSMELGLRYSTRAINASVAAFRTSLDNDLVFDAATARNERVPASVRSGLALEYVVKPVQWFVSSGSGTLTRARFTESDSTFRSGDKLPYVPELVMRQDLAVTPTLGQVGSRSLVGRFGAALTGMFDRPQPFGGFGHDVFIVDALAELRLDEIALGLDVFNLLDTHWYDSEFTYSANWRPGATARLVPERYVTVGAPRTILATLSLFLN